MEADRRMTRAAIRSLGPRSRISLRQAPAAIVDVIAVAATYLLAVVVRTGGRFDIPDTGGAVVLALIAGCAQVIANASFHVYERDWAVAALEDLVALAKATGVVVVALLAFNVAWRDHYLPFGAVLSGGAAVLAVEGALRLRPRWAEIVRVALGRQPAQATTIVVGAGTTGQLLARALADGSSGQRIACFVDDDPAKNGRYVRGIRVAGAVDDLDGLIARHGATLVVIAVPGPPGPLVQRVMERCEGSDVRVRAVRGLAVAPTDTSPLRAIGIEELLSRAPVDLDTPEARALVRERVVLVTGAAGSIGSELCRRVSELGPRRLVLLDLNENGLHDLRLDLGPGAPTEIVLGDVRDRAALARVIEAVRPDVLLHAAAYKHVPIVETQPLAGIATNVIGTLNVVDAALAAGVERLVFVSSDKAVAPASVLGLTKRFGELLVIAAGRSSGHPWCVVRFGNVLGSSGSVVPIFARQIDRGGPITITHPDATRYFMTVPEAAGLIVESSAIAAPGDLLVLEMGAPVPITELARKMVRLRGLRAADIPTEVIGLRPGEKLTEQLFFPEEEVEQTAHPQVLRAVSSQPVPAYASLQTAAAQLRAHLAAGDVPSAVGALRSAIG
jgi:FlaA1/EpsC-like NDP-sugar epimerase